jgi:hypothetical protein
VTNKALLFVALLLAAFAIAWAVESYANYFAAHRSGSGARVVIDHQLVKRFCYGTYKREREIAACIRAATHGPDASLLESDD